MEAPSLQELQQARDVFAEREPRDLFYRAATELVSLAWAGKTHLSLTEAIAVLLQTWNVSFYRFRGGFDSEHFYEVDALLKREREAMDAYRRRDIITLEPTEKTEIAPRFEDAEQVLGPVGAAKAYHLLAPRFFPIWDRKIAAAYKCVLAKAGTNGASYFRFMELAQQQVRDVVKAGFQGSNPLKALDEFNYCRFTNKWTVK